MNEEIRKERAEKCKQTIWVNQNPVNPRFEIMHDWMGEWIVDNETGKDYRISFDSYDFAQDTGLSIRAVIQEIKGEY